MKHILNEMSEEEKNSIRSQHTGSLTVQTERFKKLVENKLGNAKPLISESDEEVLGSEENELEEDKINDFDDEEDDDLEDDDLEDDDSRLEDNFDDIDSSYDTIENVINEALSNLSSEEQEELLERISDLLEGLKSNEDEDEEEDGISESYLTEHWHDYDSEAILNPRSIKYSKNPNVDDFLESVFPGLDTEKTKNAFRKLLHNEELFKAFSRLMRMFGYNSYHNKEEIFDKVIEWANERGNH